jgi:hypothetical protein
LEITLYGALRFAHLIGVFVFLLGHGVSVGVSFRLRKEKDRARIGALLDLSASSYLGFVIGFFLILGSAIGMAALASWWGAGWWWAAFIGFWVMAIVMTPYAAARYGKVRRALGLNLPMGGKPKGEAPVLSDEQIAETLAKVNPWVLSVIGFGGIAILAFLMTFKPF